MATTIHTRYVGPRGYVGARIVARGGGRQVTVPYPHELNQGEQAHAYAASRLVSVLDVPPWMLPMLTRATDDPARYVHTLARGNRSGGE